MERSKLRLAALVVMAVVVWPTSKLFQLGMGFDKDQSLGLACLVAVLGLGGYMAATGQTEL